MKNFSRCALALACAHAIPSMAQITAGPTEHVLVTMPLHKDAAETALPFTVLTGDDLRRAASATIGETLSNMPGMSSASFGPGVGQPVIRGQQGPRVRVLQNGTSSADAARASQDHANAVEALLADSVEVLRGPSTLLYGGGAIGGVVNVIDNRVPPTQTDGPEGGLEYRHDTASSMDVLVGTFETDAGPFQLHFDGMYRDFDDLEIPGQAVLEEGDMHEGEDHDDDDHDEEDAPNGIIPNTAGKAQSFTLGGSYHFDQGFIGLAVNRLENEYGLPGGSHEHEHEEGEEEEEEEEEEEGGITLDMEQTRYDALVHWHQPFAGIEVARGFITYTDYEHAEIEGNGEIGTLYGNESVEGRLELVHKSVGGFDGVFGVQVSGGEFSAIGEEAFIPVTDYEEFGVFLVEDYHVDDWTFEFGARVDSDERSPNTVAGSDRFTSFSASVSALWQVSEPWQLGVAVSRSERAPSIEELYSNLGNDMDSLVLHAATGAFEIGDTNLDTEVSQNIDLSLRWNQGAHRMSLQAYYNDFVDFIDLVNTGQDLGDDPVRVFQQSDAEFMGLEFDSDFQVATVADGALFLGVFGDVTYGEFADGEDVPRLPPVRVGARVSWEANGLLLWARVLDAAEQDRAGANEESTAGYTRWDAGAEYRPTLRGRDLTLFVSLNNIGDEDIRLSTSFLREVAPEAGFGMEAGLRVSF